MGNRRIEIIEAFLENTMTAILRIIILHEFRTIDSALGFIFMLVSLRHLHELI